MLRPVVKPNCINFSSGPCAKRPGWNLNVLQNSILGRSHRANVSKQKLNKVNLLTKEILEIPDEYEVGIVPGSDTGAVEMSLWNVLGKRNVSVCVWDSFGKDWADDIKNQLKIKNFKIYSADYGSLPNLNLINFDDDVVFNWNGTTSGVCLPDGNWIPENRNGLTICDATSAAFAVKLDWTKLDVTTFSWQKSLGGEAGHGMLILSPRAVERINCYSPNWPIPKLFQLRKENKLNIDLFRGSTINTPSMLCVEDFIDTLNWSKKIGGIEKLIEITNENLEIVKNWLSNKEWISFLSQNEKLISNTSICLKFCEENLDDSSIEYQNNLESFICKVLEKEDVALDIGSYRSAPPGLRIWGGPTINSNDIKKLLPWIDWAYHEAKEKI